MRILLLLTILSIILIKTNAQDIKVFDRGYHIQLSPDGQKIACADWVNNKAEMWIISLVDNSAFEVDPGVYGDFYISWLPNSEDLIFDANSNNGPPSLWQININETEPNLIANSLSMMPAVSPDGSYVAFCDGGNIIKKSLLDNTEVNLTNNLVFNFHPHWSGDGTKILYSSERNGNRDIYYIPSEGGQEARVTFDAASDDRASWHPNSEDITFVSDRSGVNSIYIVNINDRESEILIEDASYPFWSTDGNKMAYANSDGVWIREMASTEVLSQKIKNISVEIFPNPFIDELNISVQTDFEMLEIKLFDSKGTLLYKTDGNNHSKNESISIPSSILSYLNSGVYFLSIQTEDVKHFKKIIKS
jgi:Tol biopolymer transport system component